MNGIGFSVKRNNDEVVSEEKPSWLAQAFSGFFLRQHRQNGRIIAINYSQDSVLNLYWHSAV